MSNPNLHKHANNKSGKIAGPHKRGYFMERLAEEVFKSESTFTAWVSDNYTEAVKELGKLQPKNLTIIDETPKDLSNEEIDGRINSVEERIIELEGKKTSQA